MMERTDLHEFQITATAKNNNDRLTTTEDIEALTDFLSVHRINLNARQVFKDGEDPLFDK
jgi:hypothetical protein